ncbi:MAG TPA: HAD family hydrolase [bacterium]|nr:HAD family hydrolase [bacterium]
MKTNRLILFDIDGTILSTDRKAWEDPFRDAMEQALEEIGEPQKIDTSSYKSGGKTDTQIIYEILDANGFPEETITRVFPAVAKKYLQLLRQIVEKNPQYVMLKPGVKELLEDLKGREGLVLALLTGNFEEGARIKLSAHGLNAYFPFGAFGEGARVRSDLPPRALQAAKAHSAYPFAGKEVVIIGDTPNDIHCGRHLNVRVLAVATGPYSQDLLRAEGADFVFPDLTDRAKVWDAIAKPL